MGSAERRDSPLEEAPDSSLSGTWSNRDIDDATRIGVMIGGFLAAQPFRSDASFQERITSQLRTNGGPRFGAVRRMKYIMGATMVKHG